MNHKVDDEFQGLPETTTVYRCVCGHLVKDPHERIACPDCGRQYDSDVLRTASLETTWFGLDVSGPDRQLKDDDDDLVGAHLGHFKILGRIGGGGMGTVYRALDESLQRYVALKVLRKALGSGETGVQRLFQEARAQARVNNPHVAHIYFVGKDGDTPYLAMELVGKETLATRLQRGPLPFHLVVRYAQQVVKALDAAAKFGIVHGDVKPANMLMFDEQTIKLSDFGLSFLLAGSADSSMTVAGTPDYLPPEATKGGRIDHRGDMYSLGVTLFIMTFGRHPYDASPQLSLSDRLRLHREKQVQFPDSWPLNVPRGWRAVLTKLLAKNPSDRFADFETLLADLNRFEPTVRTTASPLLRGLAWLIDGVLVSSPLSVIAILAAADPLTTRPLLGSVLSSVVCLGACALQAAWGTTPGKRLLQIRIVDQHGLRPSMLVLGIRAAFQFMWAWSSALGGFARMLPLPNVAVVLNAIVLVFLLAEMAMVVLGKGRSIHDRILDTRVVLDTKLDEV